MVRDEAQAIANHLKDRGIIRIAQACCGLDQRIEYFLHVERRPADDLQNIGSGRLLFQAFCQLALARLLRFKQPRILDGDEGLVGEGLDQRDLIVIERRDPGPRQCDHADRVTVQQQGHGQDRVDIGCRKKACAAVPNSGSVATSSTWTACRISVARPTKLSRLTRLRSVRVRSSRSLGRPQCATGRNVSSSSRQMTVRSDWHSLCAVATIVSKTGCTSLGEREITPSTSLVAVCRSSDSCSSFVRACTSSNSRVFSMAMTAWSAKVLTSSI